MRQHYRNRPIFGLVFWTLLLGGTTLFTAWKFDWLSIDLSEVMGRIAPAQDAAAPDGASVAEIQPADAENEDALEHGAVFTDQSEPQFEFAEKELPSSSPQEPETSARLRELQQRRSSRDSAPDDVATRMPKNPFQNSDDSPPPAKSDDFSDEAETPSRVADFRPQGVDKRGTTNDLTELGSKHDARKSTSLDRRLPQRGTPPAEDVVQASNEETQGASPQVSNATATLLRDIDRLLEAEDVLGAHRELSKFYWAHPEQRASIRQRIERTAKTIYFSPQPHFLEPYVVQPEDQFAKFAKSYDVPWQYLAKLNHVDPQRIRPGQKLKVIRGPFNAVVELSRFELTVHAHGYFVRRYDVGIGKQDSSPVGKHMVLDKVANPQYTDPDGRVIDGDDPNNPLGEHWIDLGDGYGIHGTIDPDSIGRAESRGCIRLRNEDVAEVYDLLGPGSEVVIRP